MSVNDPSLRQAPPRVGDPPTRPALRAEEGFRPVVSLTADTGEGPTPSGTTGHRVETH